MKVQIEALARGVRKHRCDALCAERIVREVDARKRLVRRQPVSCGNRPPRPEGVMRHVESCEGGVETRALADGDCATFLNAAPKGASTVGGVSSVRGCEGMLWRRESVRSSVRGEKEAAGTNGAQGEEG